MKAEVIKKIEELVNEASFPRVIHPDCEPEHVYYLATSTTEHIPSMAHPKLRSHTARDIPSMMRALTQCGDEFTNITSQGMNPGDTEITSINEQKSVIFISGEKIVGVFDDSTRRDTVSVQLGLSPQAKTLQSLCGTQMWKDQRSILRFLKHELSGCTGPCANLAGIIKSVKFNKTETGESTRSQGKSSIGNRIEAEVTGAGELPDLVEFAVPIFANPYVVSVQSVWCSLDVDETKTTGQFCLQPVPMSLEEAIAKAEREVSAMINDWIVQNVPVDGGVNDRFVVLYGTP